MPSSCRGSRNEIFQANERFIGTAWQYAMNPIVKECNYAYRDSRYLASNVTCSLKAPWFIDGKKVHWISVLGRADGMPSISLVSLYD